MDERGWGPDVRNLRTTGTEGNEREIEKCVSVVENDFSDSDPGRPGSCR